MWDIWLFLFKLKNLIMRRYLIYLWTTNGLSMIRIRENSSGAIEYYHGKMGEVLKTCARWLCQTRQGNIRHAVEVFAYTVDTLSPTMRKRQRERINSEVETPSCFSNDRRDNRWPMPSLPKRGNKSSLTRVLTLKRLDNSLIFFIFASITVLLSCL